MTNENLSYCLGIALFIQALAVMGMGDKEVPLLITLTVLFFSIWAVIRLHNSDRIKKEDYT